MFKKCISLSLIFTMLLSVLTTSFANENELIHMDFLEVITESNGIYEEIEFIDGIYYYFYTDTIKNKTITIEGNKKTGISVFYNNQDTVYEVNNYKKHKVKSNIKQYFSEIKSDILENRRVLKLDLIPNKSNEKTTEASMTNFIQSRGSSDAINYFISRTGRGYIDNQEVSKMVDGKYVQVFESKTHDVYNQSEVFFNAGMTIGVIAALLGKPARLIRNSIKWAIREGVYYATGSGHFETYRAREQYYKDIVVDTRTASEHQKYSVYTFSRLAGSNFFWYSHSFTHTDPYYHDNNTLIQNTLNY